MDDNLPTCIHPCRIGRGESSYDIFGMPLPVTWQCNCGHRLTLERYDENFEFYVPVSEEVKKKFLADHTDCTAKCWKCGVKSVESWGCWCDSCTESSYD